MGVIDNQEPTKTYELKIQANVSNKQKLIDYLYLNDVTSFVEGSVDNILLDDNKDAFLNYYNQEQNRSSVSIYKYDRSELESLKTQVESAFGTDVKCYLNSIDTDEWKLGWKDSFKPVVTNRFRIYPPWDKEDENYLNIKIDPGMAFGTGQHQSSVLCLRAFEYLYDLNPSISVKQALDIGSGTGILSIAMVKLFSAKVCSTDIDIDAVNATRQNAETNSVDLNVYQGSMPQDIDTCYDLVVANILAPVLKQIVSDVVKVLHRGSYFVIAGILDEDTCEMETLYKTFGLIKVKVLSKEGWSSMIFQKMD